MDQSDALRGDFQRDADAFHVFAKSLNEATNDGSVDWLTQHLTDDAARFFWVSSTPLALAKAAKRVGAAERIAACFDDVRSVLEILSPEQQLEMFRRGASAVNAVYRESIREKTPKDGTDPSDSVDARGDAFVESKGLLPTFVSSIVSAGYFPYTVGRANSLMPMLQVIFEQEDSSKVAELNVHIADAYFCARSLLGFSNQVISDWRDSGITTTSLNFEPYITDLLERLDRIAEEIGVARELLMQGTV